MLLVFLAIAVAVFILAIFLLAFFFVSKRGKQAAASRSDNSRSSAATKRESMRGPSAAEMLSRVHELRADNYRSALIGERTKAGEACYLRFSSLWRRMFTVAVCRGRRHLHPLLNQKFFEQNEKIFALGECSIIQDNFPDLST